MQFLTNKGKIESGVPLTDAEVDTWATLVRLLHEKVCRGVYHSLYSPKACEEAANLFIAHFTLETRRNVDLKADADEAERENTHEEVPAPPQSVAAVATEEDLPL